VAIPSEIHICAGQTRRGDDCTRRDSCVCWKDPAAMGPGHEGAIDPDGETFKGGLRIGRLTVHAHWAPGATRCPHYRKRQPASQAQREQAVAELMMAAAEADD